MKSAKRTIFYGIYAFFIGFTLIVADDQRYSDLSARAIVSVYWPVFWVGEWVRSTPVQTRMPVALEHGELIT